MSKPAYVRWFADISYADVPLVGGKNASLGEMYRELTPLGVRQANAFRDGLQRSRSAHPSGPRLTAGEPVRHAALGDEADADCEAARHGRNEHARFELGRGYAVLRQHRTRLG